jgi:hypothetical protein
MKVKHRLYNEVATKEPNKKHDPKITSKIKRKLPAIKE